MNTVEILGNLSKDPIIKSTRTGKMVARFTVAVNQEFVTPQGDRREFTDWVNCVAWGNWAEAAGNYLHKGSRVLVQGRYSTSSYDAKDGTKRYVTEVVDNLIAVPIGSKGYGAGTDSSNYRNNGQGNTQPVSGGSPQGNGQGFGQFGPAQPEPQSQKQAMGFPADSNQPPLPPDEEIPF